MLFTSASLLRHLCMAKLVPVKCSPLEEKRSIVVLKGSNIASMVAV